MKKIKGLFSSLSFSARTFFSSSFDVIRHFDFDNDKDKDDFRESFLVYYHCNARTIYLPIDPTKTRNPFFVNLVYDLGFSVIQSLFFSFPRY